ncbi:MAG: hybrid sensor histidine kinase/response regulator, partial [Nevskia sp.]|nr:hybrid sensor histidine kinase/response regulator [Nevskia sp.]
MKVLVVDDSDVSRFLLENLLRKSGYDVRTAINGLNGLEALEKEAVDLIVSDAMMPKMDGFEFCRRVKTNTRTQHIPFVFYSADYISPQDEQFAMKLGALKYIVKTEDPTSFVQDLQQVLRQPAPQQAAAAPAPTEELYLREYNTRLIEKLEEKVAGLERSNEQLVATNRRLQELDTLKSDFINVLSHELRTPLTAILGFTDLMRFEVSGPLDGEYKEFVDVIHQRGLELHKLVNDMLYYSKISTGKVGINPIAMELKPILDDALTIVKTRAEEKRMQIRTEIAGPSPWVVAEPEATRQILAILLDNAVKFTPVDGRVSVQVAAAPAAGKV